MRALTVLALLVARAPVLLAAEGKIEGSNLIVTSEAVTEPAAARYAYTRRPIRCYLYNDAGLPASPSTTEQGEK